MSKGLNTPVRGAHRRSLLLGYVAASVLVIAGPVLAQDAAEPGSEAPEVSAEVVTVVEIVVTGTSITFPVAATARQIATLDPAAIEAQILGKPVDEARSILEAYGPVELTVWPDWVATIPTIDSRVEVAVNGPVAIETPTDGGSGSTP